MEKHYVGKSQNKIQFSSFFLKRPIVCEKESKCHGNNISFATLFFLWLLEKEKKCCYSLLSKIQITVLAHFSFNQNNKSTQAATIWTNCSLEKNKVARKTKCWNFKHNNFYFYKMAQ